MMTMLTMTVIDIYDYSYNEFEFSGMPPIISPIFCVGDLKNPPIDRVSVYIREMPIYIASTCVYQ